MTYQQKQAEELIQNWKFSFAFLLLTIATITLSIFQVQYPPVVVMWIGIAVFVCLIGIAYEIIKLFKRLRKKSLK